MKLVQSLLEDKVTTTELMRVLNMSLAHLDDNIDKMTLSLQNIEKSLIEIKNIKPVINYYTGGGATYSKSDTSGTLLMEDTPPEVKEIFIPSIDSEGTINAKTSESKKSARNFKSVAKMIKEE